MNSPGRRAACFKRRRFPLISVVFALAVMGTANFATPAAFAQGTRQIRIHNDKGVVERAPGSKYRANRLLVRYKQGTPPEVMQAVHDAVNARMVREFAIVRGLQLVQLAEGNSVAEALHYYRHNPNVLYAEPDYIVHAIGVPNDPQFSSQWSLQNTGQDGGTPGADIRAVSAWGLTTGSSGVAVGVIDTGIDYNHQDLAANVWASSSGFSVTTQSGSVVQCPAGTHGFNMVADTCDPMDDNGHGSHVSGTIGAVGNNSMGVTGINWHVQIVPCKFLDATGQGDTESAIACLDFMKELKDSGLNIVVTNNSWGGADSSQGLSDAITAAMDDGMLFVAAAGNDFSDNDEFPVYPAGFYLPNVIAVAATDRNDEVVTFSNTGRRTVHIGAPGRDILSTTPDNTYSYDSGTSMATPHVTGVVALLKALNPGLDWRGIKNSILSGGDTLSSLQETISKKRLDAYGAMTCTTGSVASRLLPVADVMSGSVGSPVTLSFLNIECAQPAGNVSVVITPGNQTVTLLDDGNGADLSANDGIYTGQWTPSQAGSYTLAFPDGSTAVVQILTTYGVAQTAYNYQTITGTNLNLGDDAVATVTSPFAIPFGGGSFTTLHVSSNGTVSFTDAFDSYQNFSLAPNDFPFEILPPTTLVAPMWEDLYPLKGTNQNVFWSVTGSAPNRQLVIEWRNVLAFSCLSDDSSAVTFQVVFREGSSNVVFNYADVVFGGACSYLDYGQFATTGILSSPSQGVNWSYDSGPALNNGLSLLWQTPPATGPANPVPVLTSISPSSVPLYSLNTTITVKGSNFVPTSLVQWQNTNLAPLPPAIDLPTTYVSSTELTAILPSAFSAPYSSYVVGTVQSILVLNPSPGGGSSNTLPIAIVFPGVPSISSLSPSSATAGDFSIYLDVKGNNLWGAVIYWNGQLLLTTQISDNEVYAAVPSSFLAVASTAEVTAVVSGANGGTSIAVPFPIGQASAPAAGSAQLLALEGTPHQSVDSNGSSKTGGHLNQPLRFLGWKYGSQQGAAYLKHFSRAYGPALVSPASRPSSSAAPAGGPVSSNPQVSLSQPSSLPGFAFHPAMPAGFLPTSVTTGDFDRDGKMDWVVSDGGSNDLWIYFGKGDGTAQLPRIIRLTGLAPTQVVAADLRKIGILDLVVAEADSQTIGVLLGNGDGTFQPEATYYIPGPPLCVAVGDVNGDGKLDIVAGIIGGAQQGPLATFLGDGTGKFGPPVTTVGFNPILGFVTTQIVLKDLNGDGFPDVTLVDQSDDAGAHTYLNQGDGTFKHAVSVLGSNASFIIPTTVAVGDMDGDGCPDVVTGEALGVVRIFKGTCDGGVIGFPSVVTVGAGEAPISIALADMNGDGNLDVITGGTFFGVSEGEGQEASNLVTVLLGDGRGNLGPPKVYRAEPAIFGLAVVDLNGDGKPEVIAASQDTDTTLVLLNDGQGGLDGPTGGYVGYITEGQGGAANAPYSNFIVQDLNGDGKPDLAFVEVEQYYSTPWEFSVMLNDGTGHFGAPTKTPMADFGVPPAAYVLGDFRNTGRPDLVVSSTGYQGLENADLEFLPNNGGGLFGKAQVTVFNINQISYLGPIAAGDFNRDGKLDLVGAAPIPQSQPGAPITTQLVTLVGNGDGTFAQGASVPFPSSAGQPTMMFVGDYNRDGKLDVLVWASNNSQGPQNHDVYEFLGNGDGTFAAPKLILPNFGAIGMADLNHDGFPDIVEFDDVPSTVTPNFDAPVFTVYIGQPDGTFQQGQTYSVYSGSIFPGYGFSNAGPSQILTPMLADFNGDGNIDVGVMMVTPFPNPKSYLQVLAGNGDGTFTPTYEVIPFDKYGFPSNAADVNGDGRADLLELDGWPSSFHVITGVPGPTVQLAFPSQPIVGSAGSVVVNLSLVPSSSTVVQLSTSNPNIQIAPTVTIPAGSLSATIPFTIGAGVDSTRVFSISAQLSGQTSTIYTYQALQGLAGIGIFSNATTEGTPPGGTTPDYAVGVFSVGGYSSTVELTCQGLPAEATCLFGTNPLVVSAGGQVGSSLNIQTSSKTPVGSYTITVVATDGAVSRQLQLVFNVADFSMSIVPASVTVLGGGTASFSLQITADSSWTGLINVFCNASGPVTLFCGLEGTFGPGSFPFTIPTNGVATGDYTLSVSGSAYGVTHTASPAVLHVEGATASVSPASATLSVGGTATFNVAVNSQNGYSGQFQFSCPNVPVGISCAFQPASGTLDANGTLTSSLIVTVISRPAAFAAPGDGPRFPGFQRPLITLGSLLAGLLLLAWRTARASVFVRKRTVGAIVSAVAILIVASIASCGGGSSTTEPPPPPPVTVSFTVQAASPTVTINAGTITIEVD